MGAKKKAATRKRSPAKPLKATKAIPNPKSAAKSKLASKPKAVAKPKANAKPKVVAKATVPPSQFFTPEGGPWGKCFLPRKPGERRYWLVKSEPETFSWDDLQKAPYQTTHWDGVRNFAARNFMRDGMRLGDLVFFYHSMADPQHIAGICEVVREGYPDHTAFDRTHHGYDPDSVPGDPTWFMVDLRAVESLAVPVTLPQIKAHKALTQMALVRIGRLSVTPVTAAEWDAIVALGRG